MLKQNFEKAKNLLRQIVSIKRNLNSEFQKIDEDYVIYSSEYRLSKKNKLSEEAMETINKLVDEAEPLLEKIGEEAKAAAEDFDYSDKRLVAAVSFIAASKDNLPEEAGKKMVDDFKGKPAVLKYLASVFEKNACLECAMYAKEMEREANVDITLPQRISDALYYLVNSSSSSYSDYEDIIKRLDRYEHLAGAGESSSGGSPEPEPEPEPDPEPDPEPETDPEPEG